MTKDVVSTPFGTAPGPHGTQHVGVLKSATDKPMDLGFGELDLPGVTSGIPFRLAEFDTPPGKWHLDLVVDGLQLKLKDLQGADLVKEQGTTPRRLIRKVKDTAVVISGEAVIRFAKASDADPVVLMFVDNPSAQDPLAKTGAVVNLRCNPPSFFFGSSQFAMTLNQLIFDFSDSYSPQFITNLGHGGEWIGFALAEGTFYAPPNALGQGGFSGGVRNLLIGSPRGLQGEFEVQWGRAALDPATFRFTQDGMSAIGATGSGNTRLVAITAGQEEAVQIAVGLQNPAPPEGGAVSDWQVTWRWPDGSETTGDTATGRVRHGQILRATPEEHLAGRPVLLHPEISFRFVASGEVPLIDITTGAGTLPDAIHVAGGAGDLAALTFTARSSAPAPGNFVWKLGETGADHPGASLTLATADLAGDTSLTLRETGANGRERVSRIRLQVAEGKPLLIGTRQGVVAASAPGVALDPAAVEGTFDLVDFRARAAYRPLSDTAKLDASIAAKVDVPDGALALVTLSDGGASATAEYDRHVQIVFEYANGTPLGWGGLRPAAVASAGSPADLQRQLLAWAANYPGANFLVIGRCDDIGSDSYNKTLAQTRRDTGLRFLTTPAPGSSPSALAQNRVKAWGEQDAALDDPGTTPLTPAERAAQRLITASVGGQPLVDRSNWPTAPNATPPVRDTSHPAEAVRASYRRVDIYAVGGTPVEAAIRQQLSPARAPELRRMLVPGANAAPVPAEASTPAMDYRVKLLVAWDKPTGEGFKDLIPSKAEFEFAWSPDKNPLPDLGGQPVPMGREVYTIYGSWAHDDKTGFTRSLVGMRSDGDPEGLVKVDQPNLVATFALGPVLLSGVNSTSGTVEKAARISAMAAGLGVASVIVAPGSKAILKKLEAMAEIGNLSAPGDGYKIALRSDYTTVLHVDTKALGLKTDPDHPVVFRYKNVGVKFDQAKSNWWDKLGIEYPTDAMEIEDPGKWKIDGVLGKLLRAVETALGKGSLWVETRFAFALTIGVVEISEAAIRVTFDGANPIPTFSLRGLVAKIDIPKTVKGEGRLRIEDPGGMIKAGIDLEIIPIKLSASAAFAMAQMPGPPPFTFINLFAKVQFPVGIPLGSTGCAIHGFIGQTVINGTRALPGETDIVKREIGWWMKKPEDKYTPQKDQHALGIGAVVGTLPDASFCMSAQGMIVVAFPDPEVIFGVEVKLLKMPDKGAKEKGGDQNATIIGLIVIDDSAVTMAVAARYEIPKVLKVTAPIAAYFPYSGRGIYVRIGSDGQAGRAGEPVTLTLLPETLNLRAFSYLMIEQDGLPNLGGRPDFSFQGFSVGFGAGAELGWSAGPIKLSASVLLLAGFGTDPLLIKAGLFVKGELDLVVISIEARGQIILTYQNEQISLDGEFCGKVDLFFFSIEGCVKLRIGSVPAISPPAPPPPVASVVLTDRAARIMGEAAPEGTGLQARAIFEMTEVNGKLQNTGAAPRDNNTVWPDTAPVINFAHAVVNAAPRAQFDFAGQPSGEPWFGSNRLQYRYRLDDVRLVRVSNGAPVSGAKKLLSAWITSPARQPTGGDSAASGAEVQSLKLLDWVPWDWALPMSDGGASQPGDPAETVANLCTPVPAPARSCLFGETARDGGVNRIRLLHETPPPGPYPSWFTLTGRPAIFRATGLVETAALSAMVAASGGMVLAGDVTDLPQPVAGPTGPLTRGYRLPAAQLASASGMTQTALPWIADFDRRVRRGRLLLLICDGRYALPSNEPKSCVSFDGLKIGGDYTALDLPGYRLEAIEPSRPFTVSDDVDLSQASPIAGADRRPDLLIRMPGLVILPSTGATVIELSLFRREAAGTMIEWSDQSGKSYSFLEPGQGVGSVTVRLEAEAPIEKIAILPRAKLIWLYRICALGSDQLECFSFAKANPREVAAGRFSYGGASFTALDPQFGLRLSDWVDQGAVPPKRGADGTPELQFPGKGLEIIPDQPWGAVSLGIFSGGGPVTLSAFDARGNLIAQAQEAAKDPVEVHLSGAGMARLILTGGSNEAVLWRVCHGSASGPKRNDTAPDPRRAPTDTPTGAPEVQSRVEGAPVAWAASEIARFTGPDGRLCRVMAYDQPTSLPDTSGLEILTPQGSRVTLLALCGIDSRAEEARAQDQAARDALKATTGAAAAPESPPSLREILLDPGLDYRIEIDWSWQAWLSNEAGTNTPYDSPPTLPWTTGGTQKFSFRAAREELPSAAPDDGLNEYRFDPRDIARYLDRTEPADGRDVVFTEDPLWVHFTAGHVEALLDRYNRKLALELKRTDPPPQPSPAALIAAMKVKQIKILKAKAPSDLQRPAEARINAAVAAAPCLPDGPALGGLSLGGTFKLERNAMYDFNLIAPKKTPAGQSPVQVHATRFKTSRYANPREMMAALGFPTTTLWPISPAEIILADTMVLPSGALSVSDLDMGAALAAIGADTLPLPGETGRTIALWKRVGTSFRVAGVLIDAPEPLRRVTGVLKNQQVTEMLRCDPEKLTLGTASFLPVRATLNWTRVLFVPPAPVLPAATAELKFRLKVAPSGTLIGRRMMAARPVIFETEGF
ncbi:OmpA family protein [Paracoccus aminophilus]|uniref:Outer membrane protein n=1 Tax=Paracoccus aminophilus JCM 7686 TaxID=1367847 RepID=S5XUA8_PARAH|nr:outer membrane protein [Paracoccus aminophilus]AGT11059.1 outer membrane protein [Paracoccus aminophilus JCM 7686]